MTHKRIDLPLAHEPGPYDRAPYARLFDNGAMIIVDSSGDLVYLSEAQIVALVKALGYQP